MADARTPDEPARRPDPHEIVRLLEVYLLGSEPTLSGQQIADAVGIPMEVARLRWRSLGFTAVDDDEVAFTEADLEAMRMTQRLHELGLVNDDDEAALIRTLGRSFARLAEWQQDLLARAIDISAMSLEEMSDIVTETVPVLERVQNYVWRRHTISAASRLLLSIEAEEEPVDQGDESATDGLPAPYTGIGFADIVGYTRQSRSMKPQELARLVEDFEAESLAIVTANNGRIIKTIGDEVLFATDTPEDAAHIALELVEGHEADEDFPELRVGVAWGPVLHRLGDVFGPTVNIAARLTSLARPGRVLVDKEMADALAGHEDDFRLRRTRRASVRGYRHLEPWSLRRAGDEELPAPVALLAEKGQDLLRVVDQMRPEAAVEGEGLDEPPRG